ncbi:cytochrome P450 81Q32, partial [Tanacetum coccineum]
MAVLDSCPKHNMVAYLEKTEGNAEFHEIIDFLKRSSIHHALTVSPVVSTTFVEQFWTSAKSKTINNVRHITAKVAGKSVSISEASIRSDLLFDDADGIDSLPNQAIFDAIQLMGSKSTSWDQIPTNIATAVICLTSNQKYNFSKLIFDDKQLANVSVPLDHFPVNTLTSKVFSFMVKKGKHFSGKVTPLFATMLVQPTQDECFLQKDHLKALPTYTSSFLLPLVKYLMSHRPTQSPAQTSEVPFEQQTDQSPRPSPTPTIPDSNPTKLLVSDQAKEIQLLKAQITKLKKQAKPVIKHHRAWLKSVSLKQRFPSKSFSKKHRVHKESVSKQGRKVAKGESSVQRDPLFDTIPEDSVDHMETENAQDEGRTREKVDEDKEIDEIRLSTEDVLSTDKEVVSTDKEVVSTDKEKVSTDRPIVSTDGSKVSTEEQIEGTDEHIEGTEEQKEGTEEHNEGTEEQFESTDGQRKGTEDHAEEEIAAQTTQTPTSTMFGDDETIAKVSSHESSHGKFLEKRRKVETDGIPQAEKEFTLESEWKDLLKKCKKKWKRRGKNRIAFISIGSAEDERLIKRMNENGVDLSKSEVIKEESKEEVQKESKEEITRKRNLVLEQKMRVRKELIFKITSEDEYDKENDELEITLTIAPDEEKKFSRVLGEIWIGYFNPMMKMNFGITGLDWNIVEWNYMVLQESEEDSILALELIRFIKKILAEHKNWLVHKQTACGKDFSNPFMVDNLPKIVGFSTHLASDGEEWLVHDANIHVTTAENGMRALEYLGLRDNYQQNGFNGKRAIQEVRMTDDDIMDKVLGTSRGVYDYTTLSWSSYNDHWRNLRRIASYELLSAHRLQTLNSIRAEEVRLLVKKVYQRAGSDGTVEMKSMFFELMLNVLMMMIAGKRYYGDSVAEVEEARRFKEIVEDTFVLINVLKTGSLIDPVESPDYLPWWKWIGGRSLEKKMVSLKGKRNGFMQDLLDEHKRKLVEHKEKKQHNFIEILLMMQETEPVYYNDDVIKGLMQ